MDLDIGRREYLTMLGTGSAAALAGCNEMIEDFSEEMESSGIPDEFEYNRELTEEMQQELLRTEGYDKYVDTDTTVEFLDVDTAGDEVRSMDLEARTETEIGSQYENIEPYLDGLNTLRIKNDLGGAFKMMIHGTVGVYATEDPEAEDADQYQDAMDDLIFRIRGHDGYGVGVHLEPHERRDLEQTYREHGTTSRQTSQHLTRLVLDNMGKFHY